ncbi:MAG TPA: vitamin K epoxide reductase family protein [Minicystis sp.]|nr:vitamin K epoxide reductase family protein [Minicystis sp.]
MSAVTAPSSRSPLQPWRPARLGAGARPGPSRASKRVAAAAFAALGVAIAAWLAAYQLGLVPRPWDPLFGDGTRAVLRSSFSRALPIPDALVGACAYLAEIVALAWGDRDRYRTRPAAVYVYAAIAFGMALGGAALVVLQALVVRAFCTLCLASAAISLALAAPAAAELAAAIRHRSNARGG